MAIDHSFILKKLEKLEKFIAIFSGTTKLPFIECDEETMDDQVYIFADDTKAKEFSMKYTDRKILLALGKIPGSDIRNFLTGLFYLNVNAVVIQEEGAPIHAELTDLVTRPDLEAFKEEKLPKANPELQLSAIYFLQELRRGVTERSNKEKKELRSLEEEMAVNLMRSRFLIAVDITEVKEHMSQEEKTRLTRIPLVKTPKGDTYQPIYTDMGEFQRFNLKNKNKKLRISAVPYDELPKFLLKEAKGFVINPGGFNLVLTADQLAKMKTNYGE